MDVDFLVSWCDRLMVVGVLPMLNGSYEVVTGPPYIEMLGEGKQPLWALQRHLT